MKEVGAPGAPAHWAVGQELFATFAQLAELVLVPGSTVAAGL